MSFSASTMRVSARDREIFQKVSVEGKSQRLVAGEYQLSQPRVNAIVKRVKRWSEQPLPQGLEEACRRERLAGLARVHRMRLNLYRDWSVEAFRQSQNVHVVKQFYDADGKKVKEERTGKSAGGTVRFLEFAAKFDQRLLEFDGVAKDGSVDLRAEGRLPDVPELSEDEMMQEIEQYVTRVTPKLAAWQGKKGARSSQCGVGSDKVGSRTCDERPRACPGGSTAYALVAEEGCAEVHGDLSSAQAGEPPPQGRVDAGPMVEMDAKPLSESLSRLETGNSAVEATLAVVIAQLIAVINAVKGMIRSVTPHAAPLAPSFEPHSPLCNPHSTSPVGVEFQPTGSTQPVGLEVQPTKAEPERDMFYHMRHLLPQMTVFQRSQRITYENRISHALPEEEEVRFER